MFAAVVAPDAEANAFDVVEAVPSSGGAMGALQNLSAQSCLPWSLGMFHTIVARVQPLYTLAFAGTVACASGSRTAIPCSSKKMITSAAA